MSITQTNKLDLDPPHYVLSKRTLIEQMNGTARACMTALVLHAKAAFEGTRYSTLTEAVQLFAAMKVAEDRKIAGALAKSGFPGPEWSLASSEKNRVMDALRDYFGPLHVTGFASDYRIETTSSTSDSIVGEYTKLVLRMPTWTSQLEKEFGVAPQTLFSARFEYSIDPVPTTKDAAQVARTGMPIVLPLASDLDAIDLDRYSALFFTYWDDALAVARKDMSPLLTPSQQQNHP